MRLSLNVQSAILECFNKYFTGSSTIFLYGSRVDDNARGGDIDLLIIVNNKEKNEALKNKIIFLAELKRKIGDQKIDLSICTEEDLLTIPFYKTIKETLVKLY